MNKKKPLLGYNSLGFYFVDCSSSFHIKMSKLQGIETESIESNNYNEAIMYTIETESLGKSSPLQDTPGELPPNLHPNHPELWVHTAPCQSQLPRQWPAISRSHLPH